MADTYLTFGFQNEVVENGLYKVVISAQHVPANLFGVSFHMPISGGEWSFDNAEAGNVLSGDPMMLVKQDGDSLVAGISLRRGDELQAVDGTLMTFYVSADEPVRVGGFENGVASVYVDGRKDLENVVWSDDVLGGEGVVISETAIGSEDQDMIVMEKLGAQSSMQVNSFKDEKVSVVSSDESLLDVYLFLIVAFFVMMIVFGGWMVFKYRYEIRSILSKRR